MSSNWPQGISDQSLVELHQTIQAENWEKLATILECSTADLAKRMIGRGFVCGDVVNEMARRFVLHVEEREKQLDEVDGLHA